MGSKMCKSNVNSTPSTVRGGTEFTEQGQGGVSGRDAFRVPSWPQMQAGLWNPNKCIALVPRGVHKGLLVTRNSVGCRASGLHPQLCTQKLSSPQWSTEACDVLVA